MRCSWKQLRSCSSASPPAVAMSAGSLARRRPRWQELQLHLQQSPSAGRPPPCLRHQRPRTQAGLRPSSSSVSTTQKMMNASCAARRASSRAAMSARVSTTCAACPLRMPRNCARPEQRMRTGGALVAAVSSSSPSPWAASSATLPSARPARVTRSRGGCSPSCLISSTTANRGTRCARLGRR